MPASSIDPKILIGIPSYRRPDGLRKLLASLSTQEQVDDLWIELFVADNDPDRREALSLCSELAPSFRWRLSCALVEEPGISAARNAILDRARQSGVDFLAMLDDDETASAVWLASMLQTQRRFAADVVGGAVDFDFERTPSLAVRDCGLFDTVPWKEGPVGTLDSTNNVLISCAALERANWPFFNSSFGLTGGEDREYFTRLRKLNLRFAWAPNAVAAERVPAQRSQSGWVLRRAYRIGNSDQHIAKLHGRPAISLLKAIVLLGSAPLGALFLLPPSSRLWIMTKWARSLGKFSAFRGHYYREYGRAVPTRVD